MKTLKLSGEEGADGFIIVGNLYSEKAIVITPWTIISSLDQV